MQEQAEHAASPAQPGAKADFPIYIINLAWRPDRLEFMEKQLAALGLRGERVEAVTPADLSAADIAAYCGPKAFPALHENELACTRSHEKVWTTMLARGQQAALVLEDDALLSPALPRFLEGLGDLSHDIIRIEAVPRVRVLDAVGQVAGTFTLYPFRSILIGACGYVVGAEAARKMIGAPRLRAYPIDKAIYSVFDAPGRDLDMVLADPALCMQARFMPEADAAGRLAQSDTEIGRQALRDKRSLAYIVRDKLVFIGSRFQNAFDHIRHLPKGIRTKAVEIA